MKYIDAERLRAEIESINLFPQISADYNDGREDMKMVVLDIIDSLQQEQPDLPGIEESGIPGKDYIPVDWVDACEMYGKWKIVKQEQQEVDLEEETKDWVNLMVGASFPEQDGDFISEEDYRSVIRQTARHFYELGLKRAAEMYDEIEYSRQRTE